MSKKRKILIALGSLILFFALIATSFYCVLRTDSKIIDNVLIKMAEKTETKKEEKLEKAEGEKGKTEVARVRKEREKIKSSKLMTTANPEITPLEIQQTKGYEKTWKAINAINKITLGLRAMNNLSPDDPSVSNDDLLSGIFFYTSFFSPGAFSDLQTVDADSFYYAAMEAMYDPTLRWETKYFLAQLLGTRGEKRALPLFRDIVGDNNEAFLLRITAIDQIGIFEDKESNGLVFGLLDDESPVMRNKASAIVCDITEVGDKSAYEQIISHYYKEEDPIVKASLLGTAIFIGREDSLSDVEKILETATNDEKEAVIANTALIHSEESFEMLKNLYDPQDEDLSNLVIGHLAELKTEEANEFLYGIISQVNGSNSMMAASYLIDQHNKEAIPYIKEAMGKETNAELIKCYQDMLKRADQ